MFSSGRRGALKEFWKTKLATDMDFEWFLMVCAHSRTMFLYFWRTAYVRVERLCNRKCIPTVRTTYHSALTSCSIVIASWDSAEQFSPRLLRIAVDVSLRWGSRSSICQQQRTCSFTLECTYWAPFSLTTTVNASTSTVRNFQNFYKDARAMLCSVCRAENFVTSDTSTGSPLYSNYLLIFTRVRAICRLRKVTV